MYETIYMCNISMFVKLYYVIFLNITTRGKKGFAVSKYSLFNGVRRETKFRNKTNKLDGDCKFPKCHKKAYFLTKMVKYLENVVAESQKVSVAEKLQAIQKNHNFYFCRYLRFVLYYYLAPCSSFSYK